MKIFSSIVTYKSSRSDLQIVIECVNKSIIEKLYIVDNSPTDELKEFVLSLSDKIEYIFGHGNVGYGAAHNIAIRKSIEQNSTYHVVINPDIIFEKDVIDSLMQYMDNNIDVGQIMPKVFYPNGELQYLCKLIATPFDLIGRRFFPLKKYVEKRNNKYELRFTDYNQIINVPSLSGCFMFIRTDILKQIEGFDERFFMYCEDFDLCRRIGKLSKTIFFPKVSITHNYEKGSYRNNKLLNYHIQSAIKYFNKWGWFFDKERKKINKQTLIDLGYKDSK